MSKCLRGNEDAGTYAESALRSVMNEAAMEIINPPTSESMCAASVMIASDPDRYPPITSANMTDIAKRTAHFNLERTRRPAASRSTIAD